MEIKQTLVLDGSDPLSKAIPQLDETPAVIVTKNGKYFGIIDHRCICCSIKDPHNVKCESAIVKPPALLEGATLNDRTDAFLVGHFKALPVLDKNDKPLGITTRVEVLGEFLKQKVIPSMKVDEIMGSPVFTIDESETLSTLKTMLKEKNARRVAVTRNGNIVGLVSTYDISGLGGNLFTGGRKDIRASEQISINDMRISSFLRPDFTTVEEGTTVEAAATKMVAKRVSAVVVVAGKNPLGVLSALDIFQKVQEGSQDELPIYIAGLNEDSKQYYPQIQEKFTHVFSKFIKAFNIRNCNVHVKEGKSMFILNLNFDTDHGHMALKSEQNTLPDALDEVADELNSILRKKKDTRTTKKRVSETD